MLVCQQVLNYFYTAHVLALLIIVCYGMSRKGTRDAAIKIAYSVSSVVAVIGVVLSVMYLCDLNNDSLLFEFEWFVWVFHVFYLVIHLALGVVFFKRQDALFIILVFVLGGISIYDRMSNLVFVYSTSHASGIANDFPDWVAPGE